MSVAIDRSALDAAQEVFKSLGAAFLDLQLFTADHPRFRAAVRRLESQLEEFFKQSPKADALTFTIRRNQAEFRRVPLVHAGPHGERLVKAFKAMSAGGLQIQRQADDFSAANLVERLLQLSRGGAPPRGQSTAGFRFLTETMVREMQQMSAGSGDARGDDSKPYDLLPDVDEGRFRIPEFKVCESTFESVMSSYRTVLTHAREGRSFDYETLTKTADQVVSLLSSRQPLTLPNATKTYFDDFTFHHSANVCLLTAAVASRLESDPEKLRRISLAALLHDVGKNRIPGEILHKPGRLTATEREELEVHPTAGAELLLKIEGIDPLCVAAAFGHHMHDAKGSYPRTTKPYRRDWVTQLIGVVDIYEALTAVRPYKAALSAKTAFKVMLGMDGLQSRMGFVRLLFDCVGPYPAGAVVELNTGEWGLVVAPSSSSPFLPKLRMLTDSKRNALTEQVDIDLADPGTWDGAWSKDAPPLITRTVIAKQPSDNILEAETIAEPSEILGAPLGDQEILMAREG